MPVLRSVPDLPIPIRWPDSPSPFEFGPLMLSTRGSVTVCSAWVWSRRCGSRPGSKLACGRRLGSRLRLPRSRSTPLEPLPPGARRAGAPAAGSARRRPMPAGAVVRGAVAADPLAVVVDAVPRRPASRLAARSCASTHRRASCHPQGEAPAQQRNIGLTRVWYHHPRLGAGQQLGNQGTSAAADSGRASVGSSAARPLGKTR